MADKYTPESDSARFSEDAARKLIARAIELDHARGAETTVAELRAIALETGISNEAFEAALREARVRPAEKRTDAKQVSPSSRGFIGNAWALLRGSRPRTPSFADDIVANVFVAVSVWAIMVGLTRFARELGWQAMEATILLSFISGVGIARRFRTRVIEIGLMGLVAFQTTEFAMHLTFGIRAVQGAPTHIAIMIAGILGAIGWSRRQARDDENDPTIAGHPSSTAGLDSSPPRQSDPPSRQGLQAQGIPATVVQRG